VTLAFADIASTLGLAAAIVAAIGGVAAGVIAVRTHHQDVVRQRINDVREALIKLIDIREQFMALSQEDPNRDVTSSFLNQRRAIYLAVAETLAERVKGSLSADDYATLGSECLLALDYRGALESFERGERQARSGTALGHAIALRYLAGYYGSNAPDGSLERADRLFAQAVGLTQGIADPYMVYMTGLTYQLWAFGTTGRRGGVAWDKVEHARKLFAELPAWYTLGPSALVALARAEQAATGAQPASAPSGGSTLPHWTNQDLAARAVPHLEPTLTRDAVDRGPLARLSAEASTRPPPAALDPTEGDQMKTPVETPSELVPGLRPPDAS
jgi:hypothetical protein